MKQLSKKDIKNLNQYLKENFGIDDLIGKKSDVKEKEDIIYEEGHALLIRFKQDSLEQVIPHLNAVSEKNFLKKVVVDMGAIKFVVNGSDIMRPGIVSLDDFDKEDIVCVIDETNKKPLAIGKALFSSEEISQMDKGKAIKNLHFVGDTFWNLR